MAEAQSYMSCLSHVADMAFDSGKLVAAPERATPCSASFQY